MAEKELQETKDKRQCAVAKGEKNREKRGGVRPCTGQMGESKRYVVFWR